MFIKELKNFLSRESCQQIIQDHESLLHKSTTGINQKFDGERTGRTSYSAKGIESKLLSDFKSQVSVLTSLPQENQERPSIIMYPTGGLYQPHYDYYDVRDKDYQTIIANNGGQRVYTCLLYLNDNFTGGFTDFPKLKKRIVPETGKLVWWNNTDKDGTPIAESLHTGTAVRYGVKWIMTIWIRMEKTDG
jgi:prolyl 4-hydroxylase